MPRWLWWAPLALLTFVVVLLVFRQGWIAAHFTETDVINHYAARYVQEHAGQLSECLAMPGRSAGVWIEVRCGADVIYPVDRAGRLVARDVARPGI